MTEQLSKKVRVCFFFQRDFTQNLCLLSWWCFTDSTMINHQFSPTTELGNVLFIFFPPTTQQSKSKTINPRNWESQFGTTICLFVLPIAIRSFRYFKTQANIVMFKDSEVWIHPLKLTVRPLEQAGPQKGNNRIPTIHFQGAMAVSFRKGSQRELSKTMYFSFTSTSRGEEKRSLRFKLWMCWRNKLANDSILSLDLQSCDEFKVIVCLPR